MFKLYCYHTIYRSGMDINLRKNGRNKDHYYSSSFNKNHIGITLTNWLFTSTGVQNLSRSEQFQLLSDRCANFAATNYAHNRVVYASSAHPI